MKRSLMIQLGVFSVFLFLSAAALADTSCQFSTGPLENQVGLRERDISTRVFVKVLNNNAADPVTATIQIFGLDGTKTQISNQTLTVPPTASRFADIQLPPIVFEFVVEIDIVTPGLAELALVSVWGKDSGGQLVGAHRVVHSELVTHCASFP
jgi:hypothetical protein